MSPARVFVGLGGNLGDRTATMRAAIKAIDGLPQTEVLGVSRLYETRAVGPSSEPFINAAAEVGTSLMPRAFLAALQQIEADHGRTRGERWAARTLDLDILLWFDGSHAITIDEPGLRVPHPRARMRDFVLRPLADLLGEQPVFNERSASETERALAPTERTIRSVIDVSWAPPPSRPLRD